MTGLIERPSPYRRRLHDSWICRLGSAVFYLVFAALTAIVVPDPSGVIGLISSGIGTIMMFVLPAFFAGKLGPKVIFLLVFAGLNGVGAVVQIFQFAGIIRPAPKATFTFAALAGGGVLGGGEAGTRSGTVSTSREQDEERERDGGASSSTSEAARAAAGSGNTRGSSSTSLSTGDSTEGTRQTFSWPHNGFWGPSTAVGRGEGAGIDDVILPASELFGEVWG